MDAMLILGNQLFHHMTQGPISQMPVFIAEDRELCTYYKFHKHKIILFLSAMRHFGDCLSKLGWDVDYRKIDDPCELSYEEKLLTFIERYRVTCLHFYEIEDKFMEDRIIKFLQAQSLEFYVHESPMFTCRREDFILYLDSVKKPFMKTFYEWQRKRLNVLMDGPHPVGGKFSFDHENRKKLPAGHKLPKAYKVELDTTDIEVIAIVDKLFPSHPGQSSHFNLPTSRKSALKQFRDFLSHRFYHFGPYQDALTKEQSNLYHSLISPAINLGLLTPDEIIREAIDFNEQYDIPLSSLEGFIRQIIGWREFVRGIYQNFSTRMETSNFWNHTRQLTDAWYTASTGLLPLDEAIKSAIASGYNHHIERLMVIANLMNLCEIEPKQVYRWFMEMYVDSSDWVMAANVYGMGLMSDGGIFATKPYISGSNYILKMSNFPKGDWCEIWDGLYWRFIQKKEAFFLANPRMSMMVKMFHKMEDTKRKRILMKAEKFIQSVTH